MSERVTQVPIQMQIKFHCLTHLQPDEIKSATLNNNFHLNALAANHVSAYVENHDGLLFAVSTSALFHSTSLDAVNCQVTTTQVPKYNYTDRILGVSKNLLLS